MPAEPIKIAVLAKNSQEEIHVALDHYAGRNRIDIRTFSQWSGSLTPTKKGVSIAPDKLDDLIAALTEAKARAAEMGWTSA